MSDNNNSTICVNPEELTEANVSGEILLMMLLLSLSLGGGHYLKKLKWKIINESFMATIIGLIAGGIMTLMKNEKYINNITTAYVKFFLIILLPPIIFESAYNMRRKEFFKNAGTILIYAVLGTLISIIFTGFAMWGVSLTGIFHQFSLRESLIYGSLISATDPVGILAAFKDYSTDPNFFTIVYGESILNDAVSIVFYQTCMDSYKTNETFSLIEKILVGVLSFCFNFIGSILLGFLIGFLTAVFLKAISGRVRNIYKIEISLMVILPWVSYLSAQMLGLSGIVSLLFNGVAHATYTKPNLSDWSKITVKSTYEGISGIFETLIFIFLGIGFFSFHHPYNRLSPVLVIIILIIIIIARILNIYICSKLANISRTDNHIDNKKQFFLTFSGIRGAMAFALSIKSSIDLPDAGPIFLMLTLIIISITLLQSSFFLDIVLRKCELIEICEADNFEESEFKQKSCFESLKLNVEWINEKYCMPCVMRESQNDSRNNSIIELKNNPQDNKLKIKVESNSPKISKISDTKNYFEKNSNDELSFNNNNKNFQIKNIHLFE